MTIKPDIDAMAGSISDSGFESDSFGDFASCLKMMVSPNFHYFRNLRFCGFQTSVIGSTGGLGKFIGDGIGNWLSSETGI